MSGHKRETVTISQEEYRRLYEAERAALYATYTAPPEPVSANFLRESDILNTYWTEQAARDQSYQTVIDELSTQLRDIEATSSAQMVNERARMLGEIESSCNLAQQNAFELIRQYTAQFESNLNLQRQAQDHAFQQAWMDRETQLVSRFNNSILKTHQENHQIQSSMENRIGKIEENVSAIHLRSEKIKIIAEKWLKDVSILLTNLNDQYGDFFGNKDEISDLDTIWNQSVINFENGLFETCLAGCQSLALEIASMRNRFENLILEYEVLHQSVSMETTEVYHQIRKAATIPAIKMNNDFDNLTLNLEDWVASEYNELLSVADNLITELKNSPCLYSFEDLLQIRREVLPTLLTQLGELIDEVQVRSINAQIRFNLAQLVLAALVSQGHHLDSCGFQDNEYGAPYELSANSIDGSRVIIRIDPIPGEMFSSSLHIIADDSVERTHREMVQRAKELNRSLRKVGLEIHDQRELMTEQLTKNDHRKKKSKSILTVG